MSNSSKWSPTQWAILIGGIILGIVAILWVVSRAFSIMNEASDVAVIGGVVILITTAIVAIWIGTKLIHKIKQQFVPILLLGLLATVGISSSGCTVVGPGHVGVKINMTGDDRGVDKIPLVTGWVFYNFFTQSVFEYPTFVQTAVWTHNVEEGSPTNEEISFNSKEGLTITGDISFSYSLNEKKVPNFYVKFRSDDLDKFTHGYLRNVARDIFNEVAGKYSVEDLYGPKKDIFLAEVREKISQTVDTVGVHMEQFGFIGAPRPPQNVIDALNAKVAATQQAMRAENELREATAQAQKAVAKAKGEAEANQLLTKSISPALIQWRQLENNKIMIEKWNGVTPQVSTGNNGILLNIPVAGVSR